MVLDDVVAVGVMVVEDLVVAPVKVKDAVVKAKVITEGRVMVIYPLALNLELTLYVIVYVANLLFSLLFLSIKKSPEAITFDVAVTVKLLFKLLESSTGLVCSEAE
jgi:hypothetical protein